MSKKIDKEFYDLVAKWMQGSLEKQDAVFNATLKNRLLFKLAKSMAKF